MNRKTYYPSSRGFKPRSLRKQEGKQKRNIIVTFLLVLVVLYFLVTWGLPTLIGSLTIFNKLKPEEKKVEVIEDTAIAPPVLNIPFEATNSATLVITGYAEPQYQVEIYLDDELKDTSQVSADGSFTSNSISLSLGTNNISGKTVDKEGKKSLASKAIKLIFSNEKPKLEVTEPNDQTEIKGGDKKIRVSGKTDPTSSVTVKGSTVVVNSEGNFSTEVSLNDGENIITIIATSPTFNTTEVQKKVTYSP